MAYEIQKLLKILMESEASDLHIGAGMVPSFRLHGKIVPLSKDAKPLDPRLVQDMVFRLLSQDLQGRLQSDGEMDFSFSLPQVGRFRCNIHRQRGTWAAVFRKIPINIPSLEQCGLPDTVKSLALKESGLLLVTGPSGSGKSMTLAAMIDWINTNRQCHVITIEDPIEFVFKNKKAIIKQREIGTDTPNYEFALKHIFRQDPDVIMIGDINSYAIASTALSMAGTGRLVIGTLSTMDSSSSIERILEIFPADQRPLVQSQVAGSLEGIISQQLCIRSDSKGRVLATEVMVTTPSIRNLIRSGKSFQVTNDIEVGKRFGMHTINQSLQELVVQGKVKLEEALRHTRHPEALFQRVGLPS